MEEHNNQGNEDVLETLKINGAFIFAEMIETTNLKEIIKSNSIIFAPSDDVILFVLEQLQITEAQLFKFNKLSDIIKNHIVSANGDRYTISKSKIYYNKIDEDGTIEFINQTVPIVSDLIQVDRIKIYLIGGFLCNEKEKQALQEYVALSKQKSKQLEKYPEDCVFEDVKVYGKADDKNEPCEKDSDGNNIDSLTYEAIGDNNLARVRCNGKLYCYDIDTLKTMLENDPRDPISRRQFTENFKQNILDNYGKINKKDVSMLIPNALRKLDEIFSPVESTLEYAQRIPPNIVRQYKARVASIKGQAKEQLKNEKVDEFARIYVVFGDDEEPGPIIVFINQVTDSINQQEFA